MNRVAHQVSERYPGHMPTIGGLKLALQVPFVVRDRCWTTVRLQLA